MNIIILLNLHLVNSRFYLVNVAPRFYIHQIVYPLMQECRSIYF